MNACTIPLVSIVFTLAERPVGMIFESKTTRPRRLNGLELANVRHLLGTIHLDGVVTFGPQEMVMPARRAVIEIASAIDQHVLSAPPDIQIEHIDLGEAVEHGSTTKSREGARFFAAKHMIAGMSQGY